MLKPQDKLDHRFKSNFCSLCSYIGFTCIANQHGALHVGGKQSSSQQGRLLFITINDYYRYWGMAAQGKTVTCDELKLTTELTNWVMYLKSTVCQTGGGRHIHVLCPLCYMQEHSHKHAFSHQRSYWPGDQKICRIIYSGYLHFSTFLSTSATNIL